MIEAIRSALRMRSLYRQVFSTEAGKVVLNDLCKAACVSTSAFSVNNQHQTAYDNGARDLVLGILRKIHRSDEDLHRQIAEMYEQEKQQPTDT